MAKEQANAVTGKGSPALSCSREPLTLVVLLLLLFIHTHDKLDKELKEVKLTCQIK